MKTIAYICSYETNTNAATIELSSQIADIKNFCKAHKIEDCETFTETSVRDDFKPVLLNIMSNFYGKVENVIIPNPNIISHDKNFRDWVLDEFQRMKVKIIFLAQEQKAIKSSTENKLYSLKDKIKNIPSLPEIITKSIEIMQNKNASAGALSKIISNDIGLTARVLKLVNSSYYGFPKQISTIEQAIIVLGFTTVKGVILSASIFKMFSQINNKTFDYKAFWKHSLLVAMTSKKFAEKSNLDFKEDIFSAAFLHDIGKIILAQYDWENYKNIYKEDISLNAKELLTQEEKYCGLNHCEIANMVAYSWNLPEIFCDIITYHHTPEKSTRYKNECTIVFIANKIVVNIMSNKKLNNDNIPLDILEKLNISGENVIEIVEDVTSIANDINNIDSFFK